MRDDRIGRIDHKAQVRLAVASQRGGHADDDGIGLSAARIIRSRLKAIRPRLRYAGRGNVLYVGFATVQLDDFGEVVIKADGAKADFAETQHQWQAHIPHANDPDGCGLVRQAFEQLSHWIAGSVVRHEILSYE